MILELIARRVDVTERGPASRLLEKVEPKKFVGKWSEGEGLPEKDRRRRSTREGSSKIYGRRSVGEGPLEKVC